MFLNIKVIKDREICRQVPLNASIYLISRVSYLSNANLFRKNNESAFILNIDFKFRF